MCYLDSGGHISQLFALQWTDLGLFSSNFWEMQREYWRSVLSDCRVIIYVDESITYVLTYTLSHAGDLNRKYRICKKALCMNMYQA